MSNQKLNQKNKQHCLQRSSKTSCTRRSSQKIKMTMMRLQQQVPQWQQQQPLPLVQIRQTVVMTHRWGLRLVLERGWQAFNLSETGSRRLSECSLALQCNWEVSNTMGLKCSCLGYKSCNPESTSERLKIQGSFSQCLITMILCFYYWDLIKLNSKISCFAHPKRFMVSKLMLRRASVSTSGNNMFKMYRAVYWAVLKVNLFKNKAILNFCYMKGSWIFLPCGGL